MSSAGCFGDSLFVQTLWAQKHIGVRMLAELKKHGTMHIPQAVSQWEGNALGMVMLLPKQDAFHAQIGSTQIIIDKHIYIYIITNIN